MEQRTLGETGEQVSAIGLGGFHLALPEVPNRMRFESCEPQSTAASHSWITAGITTKARVSDGWGGRLERISGQSFPDDEVRRPDEGIGVEAVG